MEQNVTKIRSQRDVEKCKQDLEKVQHRPAPVPARRICGAAGAPRATRAESWHSCRLFFLSRSSLLLLRRLRMRNDNLQLEADIRRELQELGGGSGMPDPGPRGGGGGYGGGRQRAAAAAAGDFLKEAGLYGDDDDDDDYLGGLL